MPPKAELKQTNGAIKKRAYYNDKKYEVQRNRIIANLNKLASGDLTARKSSLATLQKYGLLKDGKIEIPTKYKTPKINYTDVPPVDNSTQVINVVRVYENSPVSDYKYS